MTPAQRLQKLIDARGWTQEEAAIELGISRYSVNQLLNDRRTITAEMAVRLATVFDEGPTAARWLWAQNRLDLRVAEERLAKWVKAYDKTNGRRNTVVVPEAE